MNVKVHLNTFCIQFGQLVHRKDADKSWIISVTGRNDKTSHCCFQPAHWRPLMYKQGTSQLFLLLTNTNHFSFQLPAPFAARDACRIRRPPAGRVPGLALVQQGETLCLCIPVTGCVSAGARSTGLGQTEDRETPRHRTCSKERSSVLFERFCSEVTIQQRLQSTSA